MKMIARESFVKIKFGCTATERKKEYSNEKKLNHNED